MKLVHGIWGVMVAGTIRRCEKVSYTYNTKFNSIQYQYPQEAGCVESEAKIRVTIAAWSEIRSE